MIKKPLEVIMEEEIIVEQEIKKTESEIVEISEDKSAEIKKSNGIAEIFIMQLILTLGIVLSFAVINIIDSSITEWFIDFFKEKSTGETEKIYTDTFMF